MPLVDSNLGGSLIGVKALSVNYIKLAIVHEPDALCAPLPLFLGVQSGKISAERSIHEGAFARTLRPKDRHCALGTGKLVDALA